MSLPIAVMMTSTSYPQNVKDWKGVFIRQLLTALANSPEISMQFWGPPGEFPNNIEYICRSDESIWLDQLLAQGGIAHVLRQKGLRSINTVLKLLLLLKRAYRRQNKVSLYHVNWLQNALPLWGTTQPALITVLGSDFGLLKIPGITALLRLVLKNRRCILAPNADWMKNELEKRFGDIAQVIPIPLGINEEWFALKRKPSIADKCIWLTVSRVTKKKIGMLFEWGKSVFCKSHIHELHLFGPMQEQIDIPSWVHYHGSTHPKELSEEWFPQATGLITLSQHDEGRPQVMLEAMAAGLPIIASNLPAHRSFIVSGQTGILVEDEKQFALGIELLADPIHGQHISVEGRNWVKKEIGTWSDCAKRYIQAYHLLLDGGV